MGAEYIWNDQSKATHRVEEGDADVLDDAVQGHELEHAEGGDESSAALPAVRRQRVRRDGWPAVARHRTQWSGSSVTLPDEAGDTGDVGRAGGEGRGYRGLQFRQRNPTVGPFQRL